jgi:DNA-binding MarR family transcriptional regulator
LTVKVDQRSAAGGLAEMACACATARQAARAVTQLYDAWLRESGLEAPQFALLMALDTGGPQPQAAMSRRFAIDKTTLSRNLRLLEDRGWIEPLKGGDRRERRFGLTPKGHARIRAAYPSWAKAQADLRSGMTAREWSQLFRAFGTMTRAAVRARERLTSSETVA